MATAHRFELADPGWGVRDPDGVRRIDARRVPRDAGTDWSVGHWTGRQGRSAGVDGALLNNGRLTFAVVATRGMGLAFASARDGARIGWQSPVRDGPVHPSLVNLAGLNGFGWLDGFDELMCRCGLESNGPPVDDPPFAHGLHGRIANIPAEDVAIEIADEPGGELAVEGTVREARLFGPNLSMHVRYSTRPGSNALVVRDTITNHADSPARVVLLYHWNFGPEVLEAGARFVAPVRTVVPQTARAAEGIGPYNVYGPPQPGFAEQVYLMEPLAGESGRTVAMLRNMAGDLGIALRFSVEQLPCFTLWKCERGLNEGYVTGLEPGTNYPNPRPFEREHGRFVELAPGAKYVAETILEVLEGTEAVGAVEEEVTAMQAGTSPRIEARPVRPWTPQS